MNIHIVNVLPVKLQDKLTILTDKFIKSEKLKYEISSKDFGIIIVDEKQMYRHEPVFETNYELIQNYNGYNLLVDTTKQSKIPIVSQLPVNYVLTPLTTFEYRQNDKSKFKLIVDCIIETNVLHKELIPVNFYFSYDIDKSENLHDLLNNKFFQEEFNVFLSHLN